MVSAGGADGHSALKKTNNANTNLFVHIAAIEGLTVQINEHLNALPAESVEQYKIKAQAMQNLANWQKTDLHALRKAYE